MTHGVSRDGQTTSNEARHLKPDRPVARDHRVDHAHRTGREGAQPRACMHAEQCHARLEAASFFRAAMALTELEPLARIASTRPRSNDASRSSRRIHAWVRARARASVRARVRVGVRVGVEVGPGPGLGSGSGSGLG